MIFKKQLYCIWRVACVNWGFDGCKCRFTWRCAVEPVKNVFVTSNPQLMLVILILMQNKHISIELKKGSKNYKKNKMLWNIVDLVHKRYRKSWCHLKIFIIESRTGRYFARCMLQFRMKSNKKLFKR